MDLSNAQKASGQDSEGQLRVMLDHVTDACYILDSAWHFVYMNREAERRAGRTLEELAGKSLWEEFPVMAGTIFEEQFRRAQREQIPLTFSALSPRSNRWIELRIYPSEGNFAVFYHDITAQKQAEEALRQHAEALRENEARQRLALDAAGMATYTYDIRTGSITWMENMAPLFGVDPGTFGANFQTYSEMVHPDDRARFQAVVERAIAERGTYHMETRILWPDGTLRWLARRGRVISDPDGMPTHITGVCWDVTSAKLQEQTIRETEERFRALADTAPVMVWMSGLDKLRNFFNRPWLEFTGRTLEQEMGNGWFEGVHPEDLDHCLQIYMSFFDARETFRMEYRLKRHDGIYRWILDTGVPRFAPDGTFVGYIGSCIDIHELREAQNEIEALNERLNLAMEETHHRIRNNLQIISAMLDMSLMEYTDGMMPTSEGKRVAAQISTMAAVHDILTGKFKFGEESSGLVSGRELLENLLPLLQKILQGVEVTYEIETFSLPIRQTTALALIVHELTSNAAKYGKGQINITCRINGQLVILIVEDDGPGFPENFNERDHAKSGLALTGTLVRHDLRAKLEFQNSSQDPQSGGRVIVTFPMASK